MHIKEKNIAENLLFKVTIMTTEIIEYQDEDEFQL
jgi:hypothetical protein